MYAMSYSILNPLYVILGSANNLLYLFGARTCTRSHVCTIPYLLLLLVIVLLFNVNIAGDL